MGRFTRVRAYWRSFTTGIASSSARLSGVVEDVFSTGDGCDVMVAGASGAGVIAATRGLVCLGAAGFGVGFGNGLGEGFGADGWVVETLRGFDLLISDLPASDLLISVRGMSPVG